MGVGPVASKRAATAADEHAPAAPSPDKAIPTGKFHHQKRKKKKRQRHAPWNLPAAIITLLESAQDSKNEIENWTIE